jgi:hypothetical protein
LNAYVDSNQHKHKQKESPDVQKKTKDEGSKSHPTNQSINTGISALWMVMFVKRLHSLVVQHLPFLL